jgi:hypothetical protein
VPGGVSFLRIGKSYRRIDRTYDYRIVGTIHTEPPMPDTIASVAFTGPETLIRRRREAAPPASLPRETIAACRAELDWARTDVIAIAAELHLPIDADSRSAIPFHELARLPHEQAAARVLNVWGHLHPMEDRARRCWQRLHAQRRAGWTNRTAGSAGDLRRYLAARRRLKPLFAAAIADYRRRRTELDTQPRAPRLARAA